MKSFDQFILTNQPTNLLDEAIKSQIPPKTYAEKILLPTLEHTQAVNEFQVINELFGGLKNWLYSKAHQSGLFNDPAHQAGLEKQQAAQAKQDRKEARPNVAAMRRSDVNPTKFLGKLGKEDVKLSKEHEAKQNTLRKYATELGNEFRNNLQGYLDNAEKKFLTLTRGEEHEDKKYTVLKNMHNAIEDAVNKIIDKYSNLNLVHKSTINPFEKHNVIKNYKVPTLPAGEEAEAG